MSMRQKCDNEINLMMIMMLIQYNGYLRNELHTALTNFTKLTFSDFISKLKKMLS